MRVLVTGATGFLGSNLARRLVGDGHEVVALVRASSDRRRIEGLDLVLVEGDVVEPADVRAAMEGVEVAYHCAALVDLGTADPAQVERVNVGGTLHVLDAAAAVGALVVHVSSVAAHGATPPVPQDETWWNPLPPVVAYEASKRRAHEIVMAAGEEGARVRIASPGGIYGAEDDSSMARLIETFVRYPTPVGYLPDRYQSLVDVRDCVDGIVRIAERGRDGEEYVLVGEAVTFRTWFALIAAGAGRRPPLLFVPTRVVRGLSRPVAGVMRLLGRNPSKVTDTVALATRHLAYRSDKARAELGWDPRPLAQGMAEMAADIRARKV